MIECGVTTFADHYFFMDQAAQAVIDSGHARQPRLGLLQLAGPRGPGRSRSAFAERWNGQGRRAHHHLDRPARAVHGERRRPRGRGRCGPAAGCAGAHSTPPEDIVQTNKSLQSRGLTPDRGARRDRRARGRRASSPTATASCRGDIPLLAQVARPRRRHPRPEGLPQVRARPAHADHRT